MTILFSFVIILISAIIQGISGFGFSLVAVPLLALLLPLETITPMLVLFSLLLNIILFKKVKGKTDKKQMGLLIAFGLISIPIGMFALKSLNESYIKLGVGIIVVISALAMNFGYKIKFKNQNLAYGLTGFLSGILNGSSSLSGPPVILMLSNEGVDKNNFRKTLATYFMTLNLLSVPIFFFGGILTKEVLVKSGQLLPAMVVGVFLGVKLGDKIPESIFKKLTLILIFIMGIMTLISAF